MSDYQRIKVEPASGALGATVSGVDLARLDDATFDEIHQAWLEHHVLFFRDQQLSPGDQTALGARFGELDVYPFMEPLPAHPHVIPVIKEQDTRYNFGGGWHSDMSYEPRPSKATLLYAIDVPARGGDTLFANMEAAYEALSPGMKAMLAGMRAVFTASKVHGASGYYSNFESAHGTAPDLVGKDAVNPTATLFAGALLLEHLGFGAAAGRLRGAVEALYAEGEALTPDQGGRGTTTAFFAAVRDRLGAR